MVSCVSGGELVQVASPELEPITYRNFNVCPHCILHGKQSLLCRRCEGIPMISRSDEKHFTCYWLTVPRNTLPRGTLAMRKRPRCVSGIRMCWIPEPPDRQW